VRNDLPNLRKCVEYLKNGARPPEEIIVVDDASDEPIQLPDTGVRVIRLEQQSGPSAARNKGAEAACGEVLLFLDADVMVREETIMRTLKLFEEKNEQAVVGVFDDSREYRSFYSDYKNLWMKYSYENCPRRAALFYTSFAAIRADTFAASGGFDCGYNRPSTEDTAFGNRLWEMGVKPLIAPELVVFHNKEYTLNKLLKTDFDRAADLLKMKLRGDMGKLLDEERTSVENGTVVAVGVMMLAVPALFTGRFLIVLLLILISTYLNKRYLLWLRQKRNYVFAVRSATFMILDKLVVGAGLLHGMFGYLRGAKY